MKSKNKKLLIQIAVLLIILVLIAIILLNFIGKSKEETQKYYINEDVEFCNTIQFLCLENYTPFYDETGCGCELIKE